MKVCLLGDQQHCDEAKIRGIPSMNLDSLKKFNKDKKLIKRFCKSKLFIINYIRLDLDCNSF